MKTSKRGRVNRKTKSAPESIEEPRLVINCVCPSCDASINPSQIIGGYLDRRCPICNHSIKPEDFDELASYVLQELERTREQKDFVAQRVLVAFERQWLRCERIARRKEDINHGFCR